MFLLTMFLLYFIIYFIINAIILAVSAGGPFRWSLKASMFNCIIFSIPVAWWHLLFFHTQKSYSVHFIKKIFIISCYKASITICAQYFCWIKWKAACGAKCSYLLFFKCCSLSLSTIFNNFNFILISNFENLIHFTRLSI